MLKPLNQIRFHHSNQPASTRKGGAVIIVVLALMTTLLVLGLFFYYFTVDEALNAKNIADAVDYQIDDDAIFNFAERQFIVSTDDNLTHSAVYGSNWSLIAQLLGPMNGNGSPRSLAPYSGSGLTIQFIGSAADTNGDGHIDPQTDGEWFITVNEDLNGNGVLDAGEDLNGNGALNTAAGLDGNSVWLNMSAFANGGTAFNHRYPVNSGYTYSDINSPWLAVDYFDRSANMRIVRPSFFPVQLFPDFRTNNGALGGVGALNAIGSRQSFRPHTGHLAVTGPLPQPARFLQAETVAQSGDRSRVVGVFPGLTGTGTMQAGVWTNSDDGSGNPVYQYDLDLDGDGTTDAIRMDLDHPRFDLPDGRQVVPIFSVKILDQDSLFNVNAHGNDSRRILAQASLDALSLKNDIAKTPTPDPAIDQTPVSIHGSNQGLSVTEINPIWGLYGAPQNGNYFASWADPVSIDALMSPYQATFDAERTLNGLPTAPLGNYFTSGGVLSKRKYLTVANMDLYFLLHGRSGVYGRWGLDNVAGKDYVNIMPVEFEDANYNGVLDAGEDLNGNGKLDGDDDADYFLGGRQHYDLLLTEDRNKNGVLDPGEDLDADMIIDRILQPPFVYPLDYRAVAYFPDSGDVQRQNYGRAFTTFSSLPGIWPDHGSYYGQFWENQGTGNPALNGVRTYREAGTGPGDLQSGGIAGLFNEPDTMVHEPNFKQLDMYQYDSTFAPSETAALRLRAQDVGSLGLRSVIKDLAPFNMRDNLLAERIREQFTTVSSDREEFSFSYWPQRDWEFNDVFGGALRFPPQYGASGITSRHETGAISTNDPLRPVVRRLLTIDANRTTGGLAAGRLLPQHKLDINRLLVNFDPNGNPVYRELMPHPVFDTTDTDTNTYLDNSGTPRPMYHVNTQNPSQVYYDKNDPTFNFNDLDPSLPAQGGFSAVSLNACFSDKFAQEVWARYDRQRLARDIYVLLYTLGGYDSAAGDNRNYALNGHNLGDATDTNPANSIADVRDRLKEMAQFAVNYVDALDRDDVITRFEFDYDLTDGWNVPNPAPADQVVYGVETVSLTLSEAMVIRAANQSTDNPKTLHKDDGPYDEHRFVYVELRNASPFPVDLKSDSWRIVRTAKNDHTVVAAAAFKTAGAGAYKTVTPGGNFLISSHDGTITNSTGATIPSDFYVDFADGIGGSDDDLETVVPHHRSTHAVTDNAAVPTALADLDLGTGEAAHTDYYTWLNAARLAEPIPTGGGIVSPLEFDLVLQRRRNLNGAGFGESEWIEVDRVQISESTVFDPEGHHGGMSTSQSDMTEEVLGTGSGTIPGLISFERPEPFAAVQLVRHDTGSGPHTYPLHTLEGTVAPSTTTERHRKNDRLSSANFTGWQPHFNRDFSSVIELLSVPLYGYRAHTNAETFNAILHGGPTRNLAEGNGGGLYLSGHRAARRRFAYPDSGNAGGLSDVVMNRWFRILGLLEVPLEDGRAIDDLVTVKRRTTGKINLNTMSLETVFAGVMDDPAFNNLNPDPSSGRLTDDPILAINRFDDLRQSRDGVDFLSGLYLPGLPGSVPFKSLGAVNSVTPNASVESTILRESPSMTATTKELRLFTASSASGSPAVLDTDLHTSNRLLAKIANLTTTRSHVYAMWIGYQMHECHVVTNGVGATGLQIGNVAEGFPLKRVFCLVDMSRLEEAYDPLTNTFDYRKFIIYEQPLP